MFRGHARDFGFDIAGAGSCTVAEGLGDAGVSEADVPIEFDENVLRRDIAMDEVEGRARIGMKELVGGVKGVADFGAQVQGEAWLRGRLVAGRGPSEQPSKRFAEHQLHRDVGLLLLAVSANANQVGVFDQRSKPHQRGCAPAERRMGRGTQATRVTTQICWRTTAARPAASCRVNACWIRRRAPATSLDHRMSSR